MAVNREFLVQRPILGLGLLLLGLVIGCVLLLAIQLRGVSLWWALPLFLVLGISLAIAYGIAVLIPQRRDEEELTRLRGVYRAQCEGMKACMDEVRSGDLVASLEPVRKLEADMARAVEAATRALSSLIQQIQSSSVEVATSALTVQETSSELASGSSQQAAAVVQITATMEELARTAGQIASNAADQADLAAQAEQAGNSGASAAEAAVGGVEVVRERIEAIAGRADVLGRRSREIYRVLDLITEIAQETHILSLNAAIEAAGAGEHGERFTVVADEVRRLAERSRESVESVRSLLEEFSGAIRAVVVATEEGSKAVGQVHEQTRSTSVAIEHLRAALADTARAAREISLATEEQRGASDQVVLTLREVSEVIQRMAGGLKQFTGAADRLNQLALSIQLLTQSFRIDSVHSLKHQVLRWSASIGAASGSLEAADARLHELLRDAPYLELAFLVDGRGSMVAFAVNQALVGDRELPSTVGVGQVYSDRPWYQAVSREGRPAVTPLYESLLTGDQCFTIASPIHDLSGANVGTLGVDVNVRNWTTI